MITPSRAWAPVLLLAALTAANLGCGSSDQESLPEFAVEPAEADFERVTQRIKSALADAQPVAGAGIASQRECRVRLIPPSNDKEQYAAEVTIETTTRLLKPKLRPQPKQKAETPAELAAEAAEEADQPPKPTPREVAEQDAAKLVEKSETSREETYRLTYKNNRWVMAKLPDEPIERIIFEYALRY
jgi:hypothetical protein